MVHPMKRHADWLAGRCVVAARARNSWRSILLAMVLVCTVMALLPPAAEASYPDGVSLGKASATDVSARKQRRDSTATPTPAPTLVWSDEFNGAAGSLPDPSKWKMATGGYGFGHHELQFYTARASNVATDGQGHLAITARSETYSGGGYTRPY